MAWKGTRRSRAKVTPAVPQRKREMAGPLHRHLPFHRLVFSLPLVVLNNSRWKSPKCCAWPKQPLQDANVNKRTNKNNNDDTRSGTDRKGRNDGLEPRLVSVSRKTGKKDPTDLAATAVALAERATQEGASPSKTVDRAVVSAAAAAMAASRDVLEAEKETKRDYQSRREEQYGRQ